MSAMRRDRGGSAPALPYPSRPPCGYDNSPLDRNQFHALATGRRGSNVYDIMAELAWRGLIHQTTDEAALQRRLVEQPCVVYAGFDPTADSLHVGHLVALMMLRRFQQAGHRPIALVGGATGMIGDPSGKSEERNLLSLQALERNVAAMQAQMRSFLDFDSGPQAALLVNNYDWMREFRYL